MNAHDHAMAQRAGGVLKIAEQRMVTTYPFHARFVAAWQHCATTTIQTIGVTVRDGTILLLYNPDFIIMCSFPELIGVLHHEVNHLLFGHLFLDPANFLDGAALTIAQETTVNEWVPEPLPAAPILLAQYPHLPVNEDTLTRYQRLARPNINQDWYQKPQLLDQKIPSRVPNSPGIVPESSSLGPISARPETLDDHSVWHEARAAGALGEMAVRVQIREAARGLPADVLQNVPPIIRDQIAKICAGTVPGGSYASLIAAGIGRLDWRQLLRHYVREATELRPVFTRPPRRFPDLIGVIPGQLHRPSKTKVMAVIDTSGSIDKATLETIATELDRMSARHTVTVVECDAIVHGVYPYRGRLTGVRGRGGTDLRPAFDPELLGRVRPDVVVYFTDGYGPALETPPPVPVIWCLTPDGKKPAYWGREIVFPEF